MNTCERCQRHPAKFVQYLQQWLCLNCYYEWIEHIGQQAARFNAESKLDDPVCEPEARR